MKNLYKIAICILSAVIICSLVGCSQKSGGEDCTTEFPVLDEITEVTEVTERATDPSEKPTENMTAPVINISEEQAKSAAYEVLKKEYAEEKISMTGVDYTAFEFNSIELYSQNDDVWYNSIEPIKESNHSYYLIDYRNTNELCDIAYYMVDAFDGKVLYSGYMGD